MKNNQCKEADVKGDPSRRTKPVDNFIVIAGGIPAGAKMKDKEMNRHSYHQQYGSNSLQKPRPVATFFNVHYFSPRGMPGAQRISKINHPLNTFFQNFYNTCFHCFI